MVDLSYIPAKDDEWYPMVLRVQGDTITIAIKGQAGTIAFQAHDPYSVTAYANIRVRELP